MIEQTCPICETEVGEDETTFDVPKLPERYDFSTVIGTVHRRCLFDYSRVDELRSAIARSLATAVHCPPSRWIANVDGWMLQVYSHKSQELNIWNLADFVEFTIVEEALDSLANADVGDRVEIGVGFGAQIHVGANGVPTVVSPTNSASMPSLPLPKLKRLLEGRVPFGREDAIVRVERRSGDDRQTEPATVAWGAEPHFVDLEGEPTPVLLQPLNSLDGGRGLTYSMTRIVPNRSLFVYGTGQVVLKLDESSAIRVVPIESGQPVEDDSIELVDRAPESDHPLRVSTAS